MTVKREVNSFPGWSTANGPYKLTEEDQISLIGKDHHEHYMDQRIIDLISPVLLSFIYNAKLHSSIYVQCRKPVLSGMNMPTEES